MDISIPVDGSRLNVRVSVLLKTPAGYIFEQDRSGFLVPVGGRIKINEDSESAAKREVKEEVDLDLEHLTLVGVIENFFRGPDEPFHELGFLYRAEIARELELPPGFYCIPAARLAEHDIRPAVLRELTNSSFSGIAHRLVREKGA